MHNYANCKAFNCRILYGHLCRYQLHLLVIIISFSSPTLSFIPDCQGWVASILKFNKDWLQMYKNDDKL